VLYLWRVMKVAMMLRALGTYSPTCMPTGYTVERDWPGSVYALIGQPQREFEHRSNRDVGTQI